MVLQLSVSLVVLIIAEDSVWWLYYLFGKCTFWLSWIQILASSSSDDNDADDDAIDVIDDDDNDDDAMTW